MVCRQDKLASVAMALVKRDVGLDDAQVQSLMHQLRHEGAGLVDDPLHVDELRRGLRTRLQVEIQSDPTLRPQRRAGLLRRLEQSSAGQPEGSTLHAAEQLRARAQLAEQLLSVRLREIASREGSTVQQARDRFDRLRAAAPTGRRPRATTGERARLVGLPRDPATRHALTELEQASPSGPRPVVTDWTELADPLWPRAGYHADSGRLEAVEFTGRQLAYRNVPAELAGRLRDPEQTEAVRLEVSSSAAYRYRDEQAAATAGLAVRCEACGEFIGTPHSCPVAGVTVLEPTPLVLLRDSDGQVWGRLSDPMLVAEASRQHDRPVAVQLLMQVPGQASWPRSPQPDPLTGADAPAGTVRGELHVTLDAAGAARVRTSELACDCPQYQRTGRCRHVAVSERMALDALTRPAKDTPASWGVQLEPDQPPGPLPPLPPDISTVRFTDDPRAFADAVRSALREAEIDPDRAVPFLLDQPALYGYGQDRRFGVEVEYIVDDNQVPGYGSDQADEHLALSPIIQQDFEWGMVSEQEWDPAKNSYVWRTAPGWVGVEVETPSLDGQEPLHGYQLASHRVGQALYRDGLLDDPAQQPYGAAKLHGYTSNAWSFEYDDSVSGELVSPVLTDDPEDWRQLQQVSATIREHGGTAYHASAHVHVSAPDYTLDRQRPRRLLNLIGEYEDDVHRMARTPAADRNLTYWAAPNQMPPQLGYLDVHDLRRHQPRASAVNFQSLGKIAGEPERDHLEFRLFDASLHPGRMQAQIKLATALTDYAARHPTDPAGPARPIGTAAAQATRHVRPELELTDPDQVDQATWAEATAGVRELIDRLFRRDLDKQQMAALWAVGRYREQ